MNTQQLHYFITLAQTRSIRHCARLCDVSPAAITTALQNLSHELQASLYTKTPVSVELTDTGLLLYDAAQDILAIIADSYQRFHTTYLNLAGHLQLAAVAGIFPFVLSPFLTELIPRFPQLALEFQALSANDILQQAVAQSVDIGYIHLDEADLSTYQHRYPTLIFEKLVTYDFVFMANKNHPLAKKKSPISSGLDAYPLILYTHNTVKDSPLLTAFSKQFAGHVQFTPNANHLSHMVNDCDYLTLIPYLNDALPPQFFDIHSQILFFPPTPLRFYTYITYAKSSPKQRFLQEFLIFTRYFFRSVNLLI